MKSKVFYPKSINEFIKISKENKIKEIDIVATKELFEDICKEIINIKKELKK